jgi:hypothetical protein
VLGHPSAARLYVPFETFLEGMHFRTGHRSSHYVTWIKAQPRQAHPVEGFSAYIEQRSPKVTRRLYKRHDVALDSIVSCLRP